MTIYHYSLPWPVLDSASGSLVKDRSDGILLNMAGAEVAATTMLGSPTTIRTGPAGTTVAFQSTISAGRVRFGDVEAAVFADENMDAAERAEAAAAAAAETLAQVTRIADNATEVSYLYRDPNGDVRVSATPIALTAGGGKVRIVNGDAIASFTV